MKFRLKGTGLTAIGFMLSPLSWWNDLVLNIPLAYGFGVVFGFISRELFLPAVVVGYWITNVLGFVLMHYGGKELITGKKTSCTKKNTIKALTVTGIYTAVVIALAGMGWLKFPTEYLE
jgi:uncharacterized membrane protein